MYQHDKQVLKMRREREFYEQEERMIEQTYLAGAFTLSGTSIAPYGVRRHATCRSPSEVIGDLDAIGRTSGTSIAGESER
jgi:hypothetical protein